MSLGEQNVDVSSDASHMTKVQKFNFMQMSSGFRGRQTIGMKTDSQRSSRYCLEFRRDRVPEQFHCFIRFDSNHIHRFNKIMPGKETIGSLSKFVSCIDSLC